MTARANAEGHHNPDEGGYYACPATRSEPLGDLPWGEDACTCGLAKRRADTLRLVQALRDILARHTSPHTVVDGFCVEEGGDCAHAGEAECEVCGQSPCPDVQALARGYGIEG